MHNPPPLPQTFRKIVKSYPFGVHKQNKSEGHHNHHLQYPKVHYVYPEISTLSAVDITNDLDFLVQHRRIIGTPARGCMRCSSITNIKFSSNSIMVHSNNFIIRISSQLRREMALMGGGMGGWIGGTVNNVGMDVSNGVLPPQVQAGLPPLGHLPPPSSQPPTTKLCDTSYPAYSGFPGRGGHMHPSSYGPPLPMPENSTHNHRHGYSKNYEKPQG
jgi:hypothetical protein